ncbi:MAG: PEP-CTERM sorting domain-containing protein [Planctomycetes bacterium]|nr:PEP-CTERM sorting domain-containing protein [Planctomycetota bacterium]
MLKRFLACVVVLGVMTSGATAEVVFQWEPTELKAGENTTLTLFGSTNPDLDLGIGSLIFFFSDSDEAIRLKEFRWIDELKAPNIYFFLEDLPDAVQTVYALGTCEPPFTFCVRYPTDGSKIKLAELDVQVDELGSFILDMGTGRAEATSAEGQVPLEIKGGLETKLTVVPEPASLGLLLLGSLAWVRRRR